MSHYEEKAKELFNKIYKLNHPNWYEIDSKWYEKAKQITLIAVNEIILELDDLFEMEGAPCINSSWEYWQNVKQFIEKL